MNEKRKIILQRLTLANLPMAQRQVVLTHESKADLTWLMVNGYVGLFVFQGRRFWLTAKGREALA